MMSWTLVPALALLFPLSEARPGEHFIVETEDAGDGNFEIKLSFELHSTDEHSHLDFIRLIFNKKRERRGGWGVLSQ